jgi:hypothetical protein
MENRVVTDGVGEIPEENSNNASNLTPVVANNIACSAENVVTNPLHIEYNRLITFPRAWPHRITKRELAKNGFYFKSSENKCECVFCETSLVIEQMTETHSINNIHQQLCQACDFAFERDVSRNVSLGDVSDFR